MPLTGINILDHYWTLSNGTQVFGSAAQTTVATSDATYQAWLANGNTPTPYPGDDAMRDILAPFYIGLNSTETTMRRQLLEFSKRPWLQGRTPGEAMFNGALNASVSGNALTIHIKNHLGLDLTSSEPVVVLVPDVSAGGLASHVPLVLSSASTLTISSGSTLGTVNNVPFRLWVVGFNDGGTFRLGVINCRLGGASPTQIKALQHYLTASSTAEGGAGAADSAGVFYTGTAVSSKYYRVLGYMDWPSGLPTAGTWIAPTVGNYKLFLPGVPLPGQLTGNIAYGTTSSLSSTTSSTFSASSLSASITPTAAPNLVKAMVNANSANSTINANLYLELRRGTSTRIGIAGVMGSNNSQNAILQTLFALDAPGTILSTTYAAYLASANNVASVSYPISSYGTPYGNILLEEIMG
jgi:hypothetical protein